MTILKALYLRLDALQRTRAFRIAASAVAVAACLVVFGALIMAARDLQVQRRALVQALSGQSLAKGDEHARSLRESGTVTVGGRTYGSPVIAERPDLVFDAEGAIETPRELAEFLLQTEYPAWAPPWLLDQPDTTWLLAGLTLAWLLLVVWMSITLPLALTSLGTGAAVLACALVGWERTMWAAAGIGMLTFTFVLLTRTALLLYERPHQILAVAHTVVREASRTRLSLVFIVALLVLLPLLPLGLDREAPLRFQIQTFISRSLGLTFYVAAVLTLLLSCATVAFEIRDRQIWQIVTKPVSRVRYLLGKWVGVITVNGILLAIAAVSIFTFIQYLSDRPVAAGLRGVEDKLLVSDAVLTARLGRGPDYEKLSREQLRARVDEAVARRPELAGPPGEDGRADLLPARRRELEQEIQEAFLTGQRTVPPGGRARAYTFTGLDAARRSKSSLTLRYRFHILRDDEHETFPAAFRFNDDPELTVRRDYVPTMSHVLSIPSELVREDGTLRVTVANLHVPPPGTRGAGALNFEEDDFELLYRVGSFEANFFRAVLVDWVKLAFLAMLGIACATFLSFPVACLMSFTVFLAGTIGPFLAMSLEDYEPVPASMIDWGSAGMVIQWAFQSVVRLVAQAVVFLLRAFGEYRPTQALVEGRYVPWSDVAGGMLRLGGLWSGIALAIGTLVFRKRQLAIYSGHG